MKDYQSCPDETSASHYNIITQIIILELPMVNGKEQVQDKADDIMWDCATSCCDPKSKRNNKSKLLIKIIDVHTQPHTHTQTQ